MTRTSDVAPVACGTCGRLQAFPPADLGDGRCHRSFDAGGDVDELAASDCMEYAREHGLRSLSHEASEVALAASKRLARHPDSGVLVGRHRKDYRVEEAPNEQGQWWWRIYRRSDEQVTGMSLTPFRRHGDCTYNLFLTTGWLPDVVHDLDAGVEWADYISGDDGLREILREVRERARVRVREEKISPNHRFNGGNGAILCFLCGRIARTGSPGPLAELCPEGRGVAPWLD